MKICTLLTSLLIVTFLSVPVLAKEDSNITEFHRLLIFNDKNQLMVVKIKNTNFWVTPGLYNKNENLTNSNLSQLAKEYGLTVSKPRLLGVFLLKNEQAKMLSNRSFFKVNVINGGIIKPENIDEIKWLPVDEAMQVITFPHINLLLKKVIDFPETVWGGAILRYKKGEKFKAKMLKEFYPLNDEAIGLK